MTGGEPVRTYCLLRFEGNVHKWTVEVQIVAGRFPAERCFQWGCEAPLEEGFGYQVVDITEQPHRVLWAFASCKQHLMLLEDAVQGVIDALDAQGEELFDQIVEISHRQRGQYGPLNDALVKYGLIRSPKTIARRREQERRTEEKRRRRVQAQLRRAEALARKEVARVEQKEREKAARVARDAARREAHRQKLIERAKPVLAQLVEEGLIKEFHIQVRGTVVEALVTPRGGGPERWVMKGSERRAAAYRDRNPKEIVVIASWKSAETRQSFLEALRRESV